MRDRYNELNNDIGFSFNLGSSLLVSIEGINWEQTLTGQLSKSIAQLTNLSALK